MYSIFLLTVYFFGSKHTLLSLDFAKDSPPARTTFPRKGPLCHHHMPGIKSQFSARIPALYAESFRFSPWRQSLKLGPLPENSIASWEDNTDVQLGTRQFAHLCLSWKVCGLLGFHNNSSRIGGYRDTEKTDVINMVLKNQAVKYGNWREARFRQYG